MADPVRDFLLSSSGDLAVVNGDFAFVAGQAAVQQGIQVRVQFMLGESFLDQSQGVDWLGQILIKNPDPLVVRALITEAIASTPDVTDVVGQQLELDDVTREGTLDYSVATVYSASPIVGTVEV